MIRLSLSAVADIVEGTLHDVPDPSVEITAGVEFDSRKITEGGLFLALPGERVDGHDHAAGAVAAGAVAVLAARPVGVPAIVVEHEDGPGAAVLDALGKLAAASVAELAAGDLTVVGVTGSSGKTSTKDLIRAVLERAGTVVAPPGSFNNELGHPWTVLRADASTRFLVLELSARGRGHIAALAAIAPPRIGVELNVGTAHLGEFGSRENIAEAKSELVQALPAAEAGGLAILNADDALVAAMASKTTARVVTYGSDTSADVHALDVRLDETARASFTMVTPSGSAPVSLLVHGEHQVGNALAAAAVGLDCGMDVETVAAALSGAEAASARRMDVRTRADGVTVVNDSYNANPDSVRAALKALVTMARSGRDRGRRSWAVLGEMAELGDESVIEHDRIGRLAVRLAVSKIIVVGTGRPSHGLYQGAVMEGSWGEEAHLVPDADAAIALLRDEVEPGDLVLVKASQSVGLWTVAEALLSEQGETR
ncbi:MULTISPECIES: UDP-N-acetylmuramoyl-tripeptide--D-alanyl-D-alanine ligase [unclassified Rhodococcus (in: high G+C Gram-positive bacteria)]|uniref:UDP-N-acetylmuramoyl-tripeptide--D-alanyl-D- alanine ligase n=1 Tax=unclassified Rhodococcus (in: high G+C Gram-positive bacteria) TaxID=192944 RepID=UPI0006FF8374|nr:MULTISPECIES: UDP-N-acetylmuramoyl-tripeptide--D-alanyl-D-alanine ligase [unclassified Rhodococcus (in: high G+C Gram-positive bacteria)]KQU30565.1 UDP-N-acetylmuramoyl-tripeptide--D-alanyl-D-alanine ligase [Rhodococcus sp. Leaf225]KQU44533.1 UDP-N-acetylmuramoyl-tripeptide--D-alanyl-D-alanine ligase [Rhodococcus sp. Leaf258]